MPNYAHLKLVRMPEQFERRLQQGFGRPYARDKGPHAAKLTTDLNNAVAIQQGRRRPEFIDPALILKVKMVGALYEPDWESLGLTVLSSDSDRTLVLFSSVDDMAALRNRFIAYAGPIPQDQKNPPFQNFVTAIDAIDVVGPDDRIGLAFRQAGIVTLDDFDPQADYLVDLELWDLGRRNLKEKALSDIGNYVAAMQGEVYEQYLGPSIALLRLKVKGIVLKTLLSIEVVATIDMPPEPDIVTAPALRLTLPQLPSLNELDENAPVIGIIDSGVNNHPLIEDILVGSIGVPETLGVADDFGHGTRVAGAAVFGDLRYQLESGTLSRGARLCSAKVVNQHGRFEDKRLVPSQMREAITTLHERFGCRIFVISLGDNKRPFSGKRVGAWAATLDELARELNVLIVVSAGNRGPRGGNQIEQAVTEYPNYLLEESNRIFEPAGAINVLTVGALAHSSGMTQEMIDDVNVHAITREREPSPFTRIGPGVGGSVKPDIVDIGGTLVFDAVTMRLRNGEEAPSAGILTLHHRPVEQLFTTGSGTSYSTPLVAFKASQLLGLLPQASANLLRALLVGAATVPPESIAALANLTESATEVVCGHGIVDLTRAAYSDDARVVLYTDDELAIDHFAVYEVPIPDIFQKEKGRRTIQVTLAYDPPVRHTREDYVGVGMSFRLIRGCNADLVFEHYRRRTKADGPFPEIAGRYDCSLKPGPRTREKSTLQTASVDFKTDIEGYGDKYFLVVRCEGGWATSIVQRQRYAVVVELSHESQIRLYQRVQVQVKA
ncbi:S8 family peptidase [Duganella qianjiadongensis]|uniref:S8 family serine peptidase n=1 Tax=Duganella qianjiadongensis TaxID=2692176 RepID=A0ABW9VGN7_9BURK|nr:S8 family peptidase [Duganella qianjiadongensis]MYM38645.1 S8 family serine peptidase [Duganella qianjiadongensis]